MVLEDFMIFFYYYESLEVRTPQVVANLNHSGMIGKNYVGDNYHSHCCIPNIIKKNKKL